LSFPHDSKMLLNTAAWMTAAKAKPLEVKPAPYTSPGENEIVVKNAAIAFNPTDWALQEMGDALMKVSYPFIGGNDVAGEVVEVGPGVSRFQKGDRVVGHALAFSDGLKGAAFQTYTVLRTNMTSPIPSTLPYSSAAVLPLGLSTAACGLYQKAYLALPHPTVPPTPTGKTLLIWGGSTSVGSCAIQLAVASGYSVITTSSPRNFAYVKSLGAALAFDYNSPAVVADIVAALAGKPFAGAFAIGSAQAPGNGTAAAEACLAIVAQTPGTKFVAMALVFPQDKVPEGVGAKFVFGSDLKDNEVSHAVYGEFLGKALSAGTFLARPEAEVLGKGLECVQAGLDRLKGGVSARKIVVVL